MKWAVHSHVAPLLASSAVAYKHGPFNHPTLERVIVLARHGGKAPWLDTVGICPHFATTSRKFLSELYAAENSLTPVGMKECARAGAYSRDRYINRMRAVSPIYFVNQSFSFNTQKSAFSIQSSQIFAEAMFPPGRGPSGGLPGRPQVVPIAVPAGSFGNDTLLNCEDGPCGVPLAVAVESATDARRSAFIARHRRALEQLAKACGLQEDAFMQGPLALRNVKQVIDGLDSARDAGLNVTLDGRLSKEALELASDAAFDFTTNIMIFSPAALPLNLCGFPKLLISKLKQEGPAGDDGRPQVTFDFYLNHREILYAVLKVFDMDLPRIDGLPQGYVSTGSALFFERHVDSEGGEPYLHVIMHTRVGIDKYADFAMEPKFCTDPKRCTVQEFADHYHAFRAASGDVDSLCIAPSIALAEKNNPETPWYISVTILCLVLCLVASLVGNVIAFRRGKAVTPSLREDDSYELQTLGG